jgi:ubiquinone/menaquinone biosynthesis C-methylase UbiE
MPILCPVCFAEAKFMFIKSGTYYYQCNHCRTLFSDALVNDNMVGGTNEPVRNENNTERIERIKKYGTGISVLDFGCGHGLFVRDMRKAGLDAVGYDKFNTLVNVLPNRKFDVVTMIEVIEHLNHPFDEINQIYKLLNPGGIVYIETSFVDIADEFGISLEEFEYVNPKIGHSTIFSHYGLDILMKDKKFIPQQHLNRNTRIYKKV